jgi:hypothetical protein
LFSPLNQCISKSVNYIYGLGYNRTNSGFIRRN